MTGYDSFTGANSIPSAPSQNDGNTFRASMYDITQYGYAEQTNPQLDYVREIWALSGKSWNLYYNDANYRAIVETLQLLTFGDCGLKFKSDYKNESISKEQQRLHRKQIEASINSASAGTRLDAGNQLSRLEIEQAIDLSAYNNGDAYAIRVTKKREWDDWFTTVRVLDSWRVRNPPGIRNFQKDNDGNQYFEGTKYNSDYEPISLHYISNPNISIDPTAQQTITEDDFESVEWFAVDGLPNVIHKWRPAKASQLRGFPEGAHSLKSAQYLNSLNESYLTAKNAQANEALIIQTDDPKLYKAAQNANAVVGPNFKSGKGGVNYVGPLATVHNPRIPFDGNDYGAFIDVQLRSWCASHGLPYQFVMARFSQSNMAVSRTELDQAGRIGRKRQNQQITQVTSIIDWWILTEAEARGRVRVSVKRARKGTYSRPMGWSNDPLKDAKANTERIKQGEAFETVFPNRDFDDNAQRRSDEEATLAALNISLPDMGVNDEPDEPEEVEPPAP